MLKELYKNKINSIAFKGKVLELLKKNSYMICWFFVKIYFPASLKWISEIAGIVCVCVCTTNSILITFNKTKAKVESPFLVFVVLILFFPKNVL